MARKTYYEILKVLPDASRGTIRKAFRVRAAECHPDKVMHLDAENQERARRKMTLLNEAYGVLGNAKKRAEYDEYLALLAEKLSANKDSSSGDTVSNAIKTSGGGATSPLSNSSDTSHSSEASDVLASPLPQKAKPTPPPPEFSQEELIQALEGALVRVRGGLPESNQGIPLTPFSIPHFDLCLAGQQGNDVFHLYVCSLDKLEQSSLERQLTSVRENAGRCQLRTEHLYSSLLVMCLKFEDRLVQRRFLRDHNQSELATLSKTRGRTTMGGILHIPTGEFYFPYQRTIQPDLSYLRDIACHY
jgi:hypothetical protein